MGIEYLRLGISEKPLSRIKQEWNRVKSESPKTPEINPGLISILENFSTEEYLSVKSISIERT